MPTMIQKVSVVSSQPQLHHIISNKSQVRRKSSNLSNEDFRNILATSKLTSKSVRQNVKSTQASRSKFNKDKSNNDKYETYHKKNKPKKRTASYNKWQAKREKYKKNQTSIYRDRAKERREQNNPDYKDNDAYSEVTLETSKFLGGDKEHTHLVKGLDYALLEKTRNEMEKAEEERLELAYQKSQKKKMQEIQTSEVPQIQFLSTLAKTIYRICVEEPSQEVIIPVEQFQPNRMSFEFDLDMNFGKDMPTTLMQSKRDCPRTDDRLSGMIQRDIHRRITRIMSFIRQGTNRYYRKGKGKLKKLKKDRFVKKIKGERMMGVINERELDSYVQIEKKQQHNFDGHGLLQKENESEDIFEGVGSNYNVDSGDIKNIDNNMIHENNEYFIENSKEIPPTEGQYEEDGEYEEEEVNERLETDHEKEEKEPTFANDHYAECYPDFQNDGGYIIDVDSDDDDFNKTCSKSSRRGHRHWNFETGTVGSVGKGGNNKNRSKNSLLSNMVGPAGEYVHNASYYANKDKKRKFEKEWEQIQEIMKKREPKTPRSISGRSESSYKRHKILKGFATPTPHRSRNE